MNRAAQPLEPLDARVHADSARNVRATTRAVQTLLDCQAELLEALSDEQYAASPDPECGAIGAHVRHCLDHVRALLSGAEAGLIDYDARERGTDIEQQRAAGLRETRALRDALMALSVDGMDAPLRVRVLVAATGPTITTASSLNRELVFVLSHTIHHHALMAVIARAHAVPLPENFGCAPATIAYWETSKCVR